MALISAATVWEIRPSVGHADNGGGFVAGATGTDYSQQNSPQVTFNGTTIRATTAGASDTLTLVGVTADATWVGNILTITGGTNFAPDRYQIISQTGSTITLNSLATSGAGAAMTGRMGGAVESLMDISGDWVSGNTAYLKKTGTDTLTGYLFFPDGDRNLPFTLEGYSSTRGDIRNGSYASTHTSDGAVDPSVLPTVEISNYRVQASLSTTSIVGIAFQGTDDGDLYGVIGGPALSIIRCHFSGGGTSLASYVSITVNGAVIDCTFDGSISDSAVLLEAGAVIGCTFRTPFGAIFNSGNALTITDSVFSGITGTGRSAITSSTSGGLLIVQNCTFNNVDTCIFSYDESDFHNVLIGNNQATNVDVFFHNDTVAAIRPTGFTNRARDVTTFTENATDTNFLMATITTAQTDSAEYVNAAAENYRLNRAAYGAGAAVPAYRSTGAFERVQPTLPSASDVRTGVQFGDGGTEFTGSLSGGGGSFVHIVGG